MKTKNTLRTALMTVATIGILAQSTAFAAASKVEAELWNKGAAMGIDLSSASVPQGPVTFEVKNNSQSVVHEMLVVQVNNFHDALPYNPKEARVIEDKVQDYGEVSELEPGKSGSVTLNLKPGKYLVLCNQPGHFEMGMFARMIVTQ